MRNIKPALVNLIDFKLRDNGSVQKAIADKDARSLFLYAAEACVGEMEDGGDNHGTFVELCQKTVDNNADGESWCMSFVQSMISYVEVKLNVVSLIYAAENCLEVWENTPDSLIVKNYPLRGAIVIWRHTKTSVKTDNHTHIGNRLFNYSGKGHTGIVEAYNPDKKEKNMTTIEGNEPIENSFDGVVKLNRNKVKENSPNDKEVIGFLIPFKSL